MPNFIDLTGRRFGHWLVLQCDAAEVNGKIKWLCRCDCGEVKSVAGGNLRQGLTTSCGCFQKKDASERFTTHGKSKARVYRIWLTMRRRCYEPAFKGYPDYGGRGIAVCDRWRNSFENFLADMGEPTEGLTIDRINVNGNYEPANCRWATYLTQGRNKRNNRFINYQGKTQTLSAWAEEKGLTVTAICRRLQLGWDIARALETPVDHTTWEDKFRSVITEVIAQNANLPLPVIRQKLREAFELQENTTNHSLIAWRIEARKQLIATGLLRPSAATQGGIKHPKTGEIVNLKVPVV